MWGIGLEWWILYGLILIIYIIGWEIFSILYDIRQELQQK